MKFLPIVFLIGLLTCLSCEEPANNSTSESAPTANPSTDSQPKNEEASSAALTAPVAAAKEYPEKQPCKINGTTLEGNEHYVRRLGKVFSLVSDHTVYDEKLGESHRVFQVYTVDDCNMITRHALPINRSPDFPYLLQMNTFEEVNQVVCCQGFDEVFCYDLASNNMLPPMTPEYVNSRNQVDAQSGMPVALKTFDKYLISYAVDHGFTGYDLRVKKKPKSYPPIAEFSNGEKLNDLFAFKLESGLHQLYFPSFEESADDPIQLTPLLEKPMDISPRVSRSVRNNRFIVLRNKPDKTHFVIDMKNKKLIDIPADIASKNVQEVRKWVKENKG